ncbi:hypothetical protein OG616_21515 [Streptomyces antibioticus]|uniref:hypothetical protein n=1 Tax=Streptomyces antibioticus TaxID=1890 RepID=UPI00224F719F|nr:hypothetical protein [Streptomyces antibioticus]MCX5170574.1 hypothetical protein [Streptomyces antibioticus]
MPAHTDPAATAHLTYAPRPRMFRAPWQRWAWAALPLGSISVLAFVPFVVAWRRRIVPAWVAGLYVLGSAFWVALAIIQPTDQDQPHDDHVLLTWTLRAFIAVATVHILLLDPIKRQAK